MDAYRRYGPALLRKARRLLQNPDDAQDVVQGVFLELLDKGQRELELPYLYRAVTTRCLNLIRDRAQRARLLARQEPLLRGPVRTQCEERAIGLDLLVKLSAELDQESCELLVYRFVDDMSQDEIAELTGISRKTIGKRLLALREAVSRFDALAALPGEEAP